MQGTAGIPAQRINLLGMPRAKLAAFVAGLGEKSYRTTQLMKWIYRARVDDFGAMTDIPKALRARLAAVAEIRAPRLVDSERDADGVAKWRAQVDGGQAVETVLIPGWRESSAPAGFGDEERPARNTLCISSQAGCALDCSFCATGKQGFGGNLSRAEIVGQVWQAARQLARRGDAKGVTNVVFMGMGEPLLNFEAAMDAADVFTDHLGFGLSKRRVTVSTAGVVPRIYDMATRADVSLAVSLHAPRDELRNVLVPINRKYPLAALLAACRHYLDAVGERRTVTFEYTLIDGVNDSPADAEALAALLTSLRSKVNLIPFNPFPDDQRGYRRPCGTRVRRFQKVLLDAGLAAMLRATRGDRIAAACGQLTGAVRDRTRRRSRLPGVLPGDSELAA